eukprot:TRINITY_DN268_c0_g1_i2.p1 TRINITY_DN268_c0_g1~~TRINITY_DN268_c0_g1_i2.p1  ORF type:complete len:144 (+),score=32.20 TRINITY_DN268_c0_g1_i2:189-620(+)
MEADREDLTPEQLDAVQHFYYQIFGSLPSEIPRLEEDIDEELVKEVNQLTQECNHQIDILNENRANLAPVISEYHNRKLAGESDLIIQRSKCTIPEESMTYIGAAEINNYIEEIIRNKKKEIKAVNGQINRSKKFINAAKHLQ